MDQARIATPASEFGEPDTSYFRPWTLGMIYGVGPDLEQVARKAVKQKRRGFYRRLEAYSTAKKEADQLIGWYARDPRLRSAGAWDCFFRYVLSELNI